MALETHFITIPEFRGDAITAKPEIVWNMARGGGVMFPRVGPFIAA
jgi:hypothetical protein